MIPASAVQKIVKIVVHNFVFVLLQVKSENQDEVRLTFQVIKLLSADSQILQQLLMFVVLILFSTIPLLSVSPFLQFNPCPTDMNQTHF